MDRPSMQPLAWALALLVVTLLYRLRSAVKWHARMRGRVLPPGPRQLPIIGNMYRMPACKPWIGFRDLSAQYGDIVYLEGLGRHALVLGKQDVIFEFLDKRSANTGDRVNNTVVELTGQQFNLGFIPYGSWWRRHRRAFWQQFHPGAVQNYWPVQRAAAHDVLARALQKPTEARALVRYIFSAAAMKVVYGVNLEDETDERINTIVSVFVAIREMSVVVQFLLEYLPIVGRIPKWAPGGRLMQKLRDANQPNQHIVEVEFAEAKARVESGDDTTSVVARLLEKIPSALSMEEVAREEQVAKDVAAVAVEAGSDTSFSTIEAFLLAMVLYPEVQVKARAELDAVVGPHRLPDFSDRDQLVYINAILKECLRWHTTVPLSISHGTIEDDELCGYFIPAGTAVIPNIWACMHDPETFTRPHEFDPDRFIRHGKLDPDVLDPVTFVFGFGRRICPGRYFADSMLYIIIASVLHVFEIGPPLDGEGHPVELSYEATDGFLSYPVDCRC
ncbi:cytochrome P450, partial [Cubamyces lactineus]